MTKRVGLLSLNGKKGKKSRRCPWEYMGARAQNAVIYVHRDAKSLGLRGSSVIYLRHGNLPWRTSFRVERML